MYAKPVVSASALPARLPLYIISSTSFSVYLTPRAFTSLGFSILSAAFKAATTLVVILLKCSPAWIYGIAPEPCPSTRVDGGAFISAVISFQFLALRNLPCTICFVASAVTDIGLVCLAISCLSRIISWTRVSILVLGNMTSTIFWASSPPPNISLVKLANIPLLPNTCLLTNPATKSPVPLDRLSAIIALQSVSVSLFINLSVT